MGRGVSHLGQALRKQQESFQEHYGLRRAWHKDVEELWVLEEELESITG